MADGLNSWCRDCHKAYMGERRARTDVRAHERSARFVRRSDPVARALDLATYRANNSRRRADPEFRAWQAALNVATAGVRAERLRDAGSVTKEQLRGRWEEFAGRCAYCCSPATTADHFVAVARGGPNTIDNIVPACLPCNMSKNATPFLLWLAWR
jgi:5-methylcytosine-specific restriction endonuclease McrA